jgi:hypothetical protein
MCQLVKKFKWADTEAAWEFQKPTFFYGAKYAKNKCTQTKYFYSFLNVFEMLFFTLRAEQNYKPLKTAMKKLF